MAPSPTVETWTQARSRLALLHRDDAPAPAIAEARRDLRAARLADYIERTVAEAPPLTPAQRDRLATLLRSGGGPNAAA